MARAALARHWDLSRRREHRRRRAPCRAPTSSGWAPRAAASSRPRTAATAGRRHRRIFRRHDRRDPVSESNPDIVYVGTGEHAIRGNVSHGDGVFKTIDGGKTWSYIGLAETQQIARVRVHPRIRTSCTSRRSATSGAPTRSVASSRRDGGKTWARCSSATTRRARSISFSIRPIRRCCTPRSGRLSQAVDLVVRRRGLGIFKSTDGGEHWTDITRGRVCRQVSSDASASLSRPRSRRGVGDDRSGLRRRVSFGRCGRNVAHVNGDHRPPARVVLHPHLRRSRRTRTVYALKSRA